MEFWIAIESSTGLVSLIKKLLLFIFACVCDVCLFEWHTCVWVYGHVCACGGLRLTLDALLGGAPPMYRGSIF